MRPRRWREVDLGGLCRARQVGAEQYVVLILPNVGEHGAVRRPDEANEPLPKILLDLRTDIRRLFQLSSEQTAGLRFDIDRLIAVDRVHDHRQIEARGIAAGKAAVAIGRPLHGRAHAIAIAEIDVVAHADLVAQ